MSGPETYDFDDVSVVMGTYDEEAAVGSVLSAIASVTDGDAAVVCVDGSTDRTPAIARESYIHPQVIGHYLDGRTLRHFADLIEDQLDREAWSGPEERAVLAMLDERLAEEAH